MSVNRAMGLRWLAKIMPDKPVYTVQKRTLRDTADYIDELEVRQIALEGIIELLIDDGDRAVYTPSLKHNKAWRGAKTLAAEASPDGDYHHILTPGMRMHVEPFAREYDDTGGPPMGDPVCRIRPEDQLRADVLPVTNSPGFPGVGINAYGETA